MGMRNTNDPFGGNAAIVDSMIGNAFDTVRSVHDELSTLKYLAEHMADIVSAASVPSNSAVANDLVEHTENTTNPHQVTASQVMYTPTGENGLARAIAIHLSESMRHVTSFGADLTGLTDCTSIFKSIFERGGYWYIPEGNYLIARAGPNAGGVAATLTKTLRVVCHPEARFFAAPGQPLDNNFITFNAPVGGVGLPVGGIDVSWVGGYFDQQTQCVSTSVPFLPEYPAPAGLQGTSATCDALEIKLSYVIGATSYSAARSVYVGDVVFYAGVHWETAGGDAGIFIGAGSGQGKISRCMFYGSRDLGIYSSGVASGRQGLTIEDCYFESCFGGVSFKRGMSGYVLRNNTYRNCVVAMASSPTTRISEQGIVTGNILVGCGIGFRASVSDDNYFMSNQFLSIGALRADGVTPCNPYGFSALYWLSGASNNVVLDAHCYVITPGSTGDRYGVLMQDNNASSCTGNRITGILTDNFRYCVANEGTSGGNIINKSYNFNATLPHPLPHLSDNVSRLDPATKQDIPRNPKLFFDGTVALPGMARATQPDTGFGADTNKLFASVAGIERWSLTRTDCTFLGIALGLGRCTTTQRNDMTPLGGWTIFNTDTNQPEVYNGTAWVSMFQVVQQPTPQRPGLISGVSYALCRTIAASTVAAHGPDKLCLYPFVVDRPFTATLLNSRVVTAGAGSSMKVAIWASDANGLPTGLPIVADNTGLSCSTSGQTRNNPLPAAFLSAGWYWVGHILTGAMPIFSHMNVGSVEMAFLLGSTATVNSVSSPVLALTLDQPYANDIAATNLTGASYGRITNVGIPVFSLSVA